MTYKEMNGLLFFDVGHQRKIEGRTTFINDVLLQEYHIAFLKFHPHVNL